jgi:hypothetical protein
MNVRICLSVLLMVVCLGAVGILAQHRQLAGLKDQKAQILAQLSGTPDARSAIPGSPDAAIPDSSDSGSAVSSELLQLRRQVVQLTDRKRELAGASAENEKLRTQLTARGTNSDSAKFFPAGYVRKATAQWAGLDTPENALQSFLWAVQNHDTNGLFRVITPQVGERWRQQFGDSPEKFFEDSSAIPGYHITDKRSWSADQGEFVEFTVETVPGIKGEQIYLRRIGDEWRLDNVTH